MEKTPPVGTSYGSYNFFSTVYMCLLLFDAIIITIIIIIISVSVNKSLFIGVIYDLSRCRRNWRGSAASRLILWRRFRLNLKDNQLFY